MADDSADNQDKQIPEESQAVSPKISNRQSISGLAGTVLLVVFLVAILAWIRFAPISKQASEEDESPAQQEVEKNAQEKADDLRDSQVNDALDAFLNLNYKGWQKQGKSFDDRASDEDRMQIFDVHLVNGDKNQVIAVCVEKFQKDDDGEYWFAYQPDNTQMLELKIKSAGKKPADDKDSPGQDESSNNN